MALNMIIMPPIKAIIPDAASIPIAGSSRIIILFCGFCGLKESYASKNDHIFYYTVKSPGAALRVVARDGYGNVFEQTEITTPLEADYPDAY